MTIPPLRVVGALVVLSCCSAIAGPFGLEPGMSKRDVAAAVGQGNLKPEGHGWYAAAKVPKSHPQFSGYSLLISPKYGLVAILASSSSLETSSYGTELKGKYDDLRTSLIGTYGKPGGNYDYLRSGSIWSEPKDWMMALKKKERALAAYWVDGKKKGDVDLPAGMQGISLDAVALSTEKGMLLLKYEFDNFDKELAERKAVEDDAL